MLGGTNVLEILALAGGHIDVMDYDPLYLDVMKKLMESKLLLKDDIQDHDLLYNACSPATLMRFEFLAGWCPEGLKTYQYDGLPLIHAKIAQSNVFPWSSRPH